jgi:hypothetical protein
LSRPASKEQAIEGEGAKAFEAFLVYRKLGPARTAKKAAAKLKKHYSLLEKWSMQHNWIARAKRWDEEVAQAEAEAELAEIKAMRRRQIKMALEMQNISSKELKKVKEISKKYKEAPVVDTKVALKMAELGTNLERLNRGEPNDISETVVVEEPDYSNLSADDLRELRRIKRKMNKK